MKEINIDLEKITLQGLLTIPTGAKGIVVFAHGSGSSRLSPRNQYVAKALNTGGLATLLFDLLTADEDVIDQQTREYRFNIPLLAGRLVEVTDWLVQQQELADLNIGYFGSSTGAAAALIAAAERMGAAKAVVSRGGRPDLAGDALPHVTSPTLLIVGGLDYGVIELNQEAKAKMRSANKVDIAIVSGATHLFEEAGCLDKVNDLARDFFIQHLIATQRG